MAARSAGDIQPDRVRFWLDRSRECCSLMVERLQVVAVVPNYNTADNLANLLPKVLQQGYDRVFVLDDGSTDHSVGVIRGSTR